jgi:predicted CopG family antitoxin
MASKSTRSAGQKGAPKKASPKRPRGATGKKKPFNKLRTVKGLLEEVAEELHAKKGKPSVSDFIRLLELEKTLRGDKRGKIEVAWVEPEQAANSDDTSGSEK